MIHLVGNLSVEDVCGFGDDIVLEATEASSPPLLDVGHIPGGVETAERKQIHYLAAHLVIRGDDALDFALHV